MVIPNKQNGTDKTHHIHTYRETHTKHQIQMIETEKERNANDTEKKVKTRIVFGKCFGCSVR